MPNYRIENNETGEFLDISGPQPPTQEVADEIFQNYYESKRTASGQAFETAKGIGRGFANAFLSAGEGLESLLMLVLTQ